LDALVSFAFNVGLGALQRSTLRQKHNRGDYEGASKEFLKYTKGGGKVLPGLVKRRNDERALYLGG
jgi:lysozyme